MLYYLPLIITVVANLFYHIAQKYTSQNINPVFSLLITYMTATALTAAALLFYRHENTVADNIKELGWPSFALGLAVVLLELGYLLVYRAGWNISTASIISTITLTILLVPVGRYLFHESISPVNIVGIGISIIGIVLINYK